MLRPRPTVALSRGEPVNAVWLVIAAVCSYLVAYRYYSLFVARTVAGVDATRLTPAMRRNDVSLAMKNEALH